VLTIVTTIRTRSIRERGDTLGDVGVVFDGGSDHLAQGQSLR